MAEEANAVVAAMRLIQIDRPNWNVTEEMVRLWKAEFDERTPEILLRAARRFISTVSNRPTIKAFHDCLSAVSAEERDKEAQSDAEKPKESFLESTMDELNRIKAKHPWYNPGSTMVENLQRCQAYRGTKVAGHPFIGGGIKEMFNK